MFTSLTKVTAAVAVLLAFAPQAAPASSAHSHSTHHQPIRQPKPSCDDDAKGPFNSVFQYTCAYEAFRDRSMVLVDPIKAQEFKKLWNPAILAQSPELKMIGVSDKDREALTFSLIRRMRDFTHERFDYVETPEDVKEEKESEISPVTAGGIGLSLRLEKQWEIDKAVAAIDGVTDAELLKKTRQLAEISPEHRIVVDSVVQDSPSDGKMQPGDIVLAVDGMSVNGLDLDDVTTDKMHGKSGTKVDLDVLRKDAQGNLHNITVTLVRAEFADRTVSVDDVNGIRHITVGDFVNDHLLGDLARALREAKAQHLKGVDIDIRENGGGRLDYVLAMLEMTEDRGQLLSIRERVAGTPNLLQCDYSVLDNFGITISHNVGDLANPKAVYATREAFTPAYEAAARDDPNYVYEHPLQAIIDADMPVVVTQNGDSYSASEIFSGAIQATHRGSIVGKPSGGKGAIMIEVDLPHGGQLSVTDGQFYPGGNDTKYIGILPDYDVAQADDFGETDAQKDKAGAVIEEAYERAQSRKTEATARVKINSDRFEDDMTKRDAKDKEPVKLGVEAVTALE